MTVLSTLLEITIYSAMLFGAIWLFRLWLKKHLSPAMLYMAWFILIARLLIPVTIASGLSLIAIPAQERTVQAESVDLTELLEGLNNTVVLDQSETQTQTDGTVQQSESSMQQAAQNAATETSAISSSNVPLEINWESALIAIWLAGVAVMLIQMGVSTIRLKMRLKNAGSVPPEWQHMAEEIESELGIRRSVRAVMIAGFPSPALSAGFRPVVVLPKEMLEKSDESVRFALLHEMTHIKRGDHFMSLLLLLLRAVYWFNPVVWLMTKQIRLDMETACDSTLARPMGISDRKRYAGTMLSMYAQEQVRYVLGMALGQTKKTAERRLRGVFMRGKSSRKGKGMAIALAAVLIVSCFTTACQPTPEEPIVVGKDQDEMLEAALLTDASGDGEDDTGFSLTDITVPDTYEFSTIGAEGKLTVSVEAPVRLPDANMLPSAKVVPGKFTQEMVSGMLDYLYDDTPYYQNDKRRTKDELQNQILDLQKRIAEGDFEDHPDMLESQQQRIEDLQSRLETAPEERDEPSLSDGTMIQNSEMGSYSIDVNSVDSDTGYRIASFSCYSSAGSLKLLDGLMERIDESRLHYSNYSSEDDQYYNYTMDGAQRVYNDADIPDDLQAKLGVTLEDAKEQVQGMLDAGGIEDMACSAAFVIDDHGTGHVDDYTGVASDFAYKLFYTRSVNGVPVLPTSEYAQNSRTEYDYTWVYESLQVIVTDGGIVNISWHSPCTVSEMITDDTNVIDFNEAAKIFEKKIMTFYEARVDAYGYDSIDIDIDNIELGLLRIKQQNAQGQKAGLYVPVWAFGGTVKMTSTQPDGYTYIGYDHGCDFPDKPYIVLAVNAINGSIIDMEAGY